MCIKSKFSKRAESQNNEGKRCDQSCSKLAGFGSSGSLEEHGLAKYSCIFSQDQASHKVSNSSKGVLRTNDLTSLFHISCLSALYSKVRVILAFD